MLLTTFKWLSWLSALGLIVLVFFVTMLVARSVGTSELIVTFVLAGIISLPGWIIHFVQKPKKPKTV